MKRKFFQRLSSAFLSLLMLVALAVPAYAAGTPSTSVECYVYARTSAGSDPFQVNTPPTEITKAIGSYPESVSSGALDFIPWPSEVVLNIQGEDGLETWTFDGVRILYLDSTSDIGVRIVTLSDAESCAAFKAPETSMLEIDYIWNVEEPPYERPAITNFIYSVDRTVAQNDSNLTAVENENEVDVYRVTQDVNGDKTGLTLTYNTSMDMTNLGFDENYGDGSWNLLQANKDWITDGTWVDLHFVFDDRIDMKTLNTDNAKLTSDMFVLRNDVKSFEVKGQELIVHCRWDSAMAQADNELNPIITFNGVKVDLPSDWDDSITITNHGSVNGWVYAESKTDNVNLNAEIRGGDTDDVFILTVDKASEPGMDKTIVLEDGSEVDKDTVAAGTTVEFQLESNVPENLKEYITYPVPSDPAISTNSLGNAGEYTLVFHDKMDANLALDTESFVVKLGDTTIDSKYYTITTSGLGDGCTFEVSVDLAAMYNDDVITEANLGVTPITVNYKATLSEQATAGAYINEAWVHYPNADSEHDKVPVYTYGINIFKYDQGSIKGEGESWTATGLKGAEFALYKEADVTVDGDNVTINQGAEPVWTGTSNEEGYVVANGLDDGVYYLFETKAPDNYAKSDKPLKVTVTPTADFADEDAYYLVDVKFANTLIPHTGGMGTTMFTIGGGVIVAAAAILFVVSRKKRKSK